MNKFLTKIFLYAVPGLLLLFSQLFGRFLFVKALCPFFRGISARFFLFSVPLILLYFIFYGLAKLIIEIRKGKIGSRFQTRILFQFVLVVVITVLPLILFLNGMFNRTMDLWVMTDLRTAMASSLDLARKQEDLLRVETDKISSSVLQLFESPDPGLDLRSKIPDAAALFDSLNADYYRLYLDHRSVLSSSSQRAPSVLFNLKNLREYGNKKSFSLKKEMNGHWYVLSVSRSAVPDVIVVAGLAFPKTTGMHIHNIEQGYLLYEQLSLFKQPIRAYLFLLIADFLILILFVSMLLSLLLAKQISKPIYMLHEGTRNIASGNLNFFLDYRKHDEMRLLVTSFNNMVKELAFNQEAVLHSQHVDAWKKMAERSIREIRKQRPEIAGALNDLNKQLDQSEISNIKEGMDFLQKRINALFLKIDGLEAFTDRPALALKKENLNDIIRDVMEMFEGVTSGLSYYVELDNSIPLLNINREQIHQLLVNLVKNSIEAIPIREKGLIGIKTLYNKRFADSSVLVEVSDNGTGIPDDILPRIYEPYFTTKKKKQGLGLSIVHRIVQEHGIRLGCRRVDGRTIFSLELKV